jgi:predicted small metal-binding protein
VIDGRAPEVSQLGWLSAMNKEIAMSSKQYKKIGCLDVNPKGGCAFEVRAESEDEVMRILSDHARKTHKMESVPPEMAAKLKSSMKSVTVNV